MTISCPRETRVELDLREADAQEQLVQLLARIEPMSQAECAHVPSSDVEPSLSMCLQSSTSHDAEPPALPQGLLGTRRRQDPGEDLFTYHIEYKHTASPCHLPPFSRVQRRILTLLSFPVDIYTRLCLDCDKPP